MSQLEPSTSYIYEKADGVVYARKFGESTRIVIGYDADFEKLNEDLEAAKLWQEISKEAKKNKNLARAIDKIKVLYRLSKDDPL